VESVRRGQKPRSKQLVSLGAGNFAGIPPSSALAGGVLAFASNCRLTLGTPTESRNGVGGWKKSCGGRGAKILEFDGSENSSKEGSGS